MAVRKLANGKYQVDWYNGTKRERRNFTTKNAAEAFDRDRRLREIYGAHREDRSDSKTLIEAMTWYHRTVSTTKDPHTCETEKHYFAVLYECLRSNEVILRDPKSAPLDSIDQVELPHLTAIQSYLTSTPTHGMCRAREKLRSRGRSNAEGLKLRLSANELTAFVSNVVARAVENFSTIDLPEKCKPTGRKVRSNCVSQVMVGSSVNRMFNTYKDFFNRCDQNGWLSKNPSIYLKSLRENPKKKKVHDDRTVQAIISEAYLRAEKFEGLISQNWKDVGDTLWFLAKTGARPIGLKRLRWAHLDFETREMELRSNKGRGEQKIHVVPLTNELYEFLVERRDVARRHFKAKNDSPIFFAAQGGEFDSKAFARTVAKLCEKIGVEEFSPYCLRHGFVTRARRIGIAVQDTGDLAGHSNLETTRKIYDHTSAGDRRPAMTSIGNALKIERK